jgi:hypothetical protein
VKKSAKVLRWPHSQTSGDPSAELQKHNICRASIQIGDKIDLRVKSFGFLNLNFKTNRA